MIEDSAQLFTGLVVGIAFGLVLIAAAFFQDVLIGLYRWCFRATIRVSRPVMCGVGGAVVQGGAALSRVVRDVARAGLPRALWRRRAADAVTSGEEAAELTSRFPVERTVEEDNAADEGTAAIVAADPSIAVVRGVREDAVGELGRRRRYEPVSSLQVEEAVQRFFVGREEAASLDSFVRHLDRQFGSGLGVALLESLRARGFVEVRRDPRRTVRLLVRLTDAGAASLRAR